MDPQANYRFPAKDGQPLQPLSAERVNGGRPLSSISTTTTSKSTKYTESESQDLNGSPQSSPTRRTKAHLSMEPANTVSGFALPQSPSLPEIHTLRSHGRTNSDVQGLVKRFEHLDVRDRDAESSEHRKRHEAELRRAHIAREEAESDVRRLREEVRRMRKEGDESRERERKVAKRLEAVTEDSNTLKESTGSQHSIYEKELRKARKEAFKSSSAVLKLQEELKSTRNTLRITQSGFDLEKEKVQRKEQDRFEMEYRLIPLQEQVDQLKEKLRVSEGEREALKTNLKEEEVARIAAEGMIALPTSQDMDVDLMNSPRKSPNKAKVHHDMEEDKENMGGIAKKTSEIRRLAEDLEREKMRREAVEELVDFLRMECKFQCCGCKTASRMGHEFALEMDAELAAGVDRIRADMEDILTPPHRAHGEDQMDVESTVVRTHQSPQPPAEVTTQLELDQVPPTNEDMDRSMGFTAEERPQSPPADDQPNEDQDQAPTQTPPEPTVESVPQPPTDPSTPPQSFHHRTNSRNQFSIRTVTTTTQIPMHFTPASKPAHHHAPVFDEDEDAENIPPTPQDTTQPKFDRAAALAAIEYRRGRAKSIANGHATPRKQMMEGLGGRRDISAPALGGKSAGGVSSSVGKGTRSVTRTR